MDLFDIVAARVGGTGGGETPQKQADWEQNDSSKKDYIKNRTHWKEEVEVDYLTLPYAEPIPGFGFAPYGRKIGLELNTSYNIEVEVDGQIYTFPATTSEIPKEILGVVVPGVVYLYLEEIDLQIVDGIDGDFATSTITGTDNCYYTFADALTKIKIHGIPGTDTIIHKIPKEYCDFPKVDQVFNPESKNAQSGIAVNQAIVEYDNSLIVGTKKLEDKSITTQKLADDSVDSDKIKELSVQGKHIAYRTIEPDSLKEGIPTEKISIKDKSTLIKASEDVQILALGPTFLRDVPWKDILIKGTIYFTCAGDQTIYIAHGFDISERSVFLRFPVSVPEAGVGYKFCCLLHKLRTEFVSKVYMAEAFLYTEDVYEYPSDILAEIAIPAHMPTKSPSDNSLIIFVKNDDNTAKFKGGIGDSTQIYVTLNDSMKGVIL